MSLMLSQPKIDIASPVSASAWFDPPVVGPGELSFYRITFNALEESIDAPTEIKVPPNLDLRPGAHGQIYQLTGISMEPHTTFNYRARSSEAGSITVPEFSLKVYGKPIRVPAARLDVTNSPAGISSAPSQLILEIATTNLFAGQPAAVRVLFPGSPSGLMQVPSQVQLTGDGLITDAGAARQRIESMVRGGVNTATYIYETVIIPLTAGKLSVLAQGFTTGGRFSRTIIINGTATFPTDPSQFTLLESDPVELLVRPLPRGGQLPGFTGAIGIFTVDPPKLATNSLRVGDPVKLSVAVRGGSGFSRLVAPPVPQVPDWQVFAATTQGEPAHLLQAHGFATFDYTLIPMSAEARATPPIPFSCFDPTRAAYTDLTIPSLPVTVIPSATVADLQLIEQNTSKSSEPDEELSLSTLAAAPGPSVSSLRPLQREPWFPFVQFAPALGFVGLWGWDRRRRYLEQHPEIILRRRARRGLRRELRKLRRAARAGDAPRFATAAVSAMRIASAPHFPAEPNALVGSDVLELVGGFKDPSHSASASVVRRFFASTDASRFSSDSGTSSDLLVLQPDVERVLENLEARL